MQVIGQDLDQARQTADMLITMICVVGEARGTYAGPSQDLDQARQTADMLITMIYVVGEARGTYAGDRSGP